MRQRDTWTGIHGRLLFRGHLIPNFCIEGNRIEAQFRTSSGFLLFVSGSHLMIYYLPANFSGAEWATVSDRTFKESERIYSTPIEARPSQLGMRSLRHIEVEDDRNIQFYMFPRGWYRLTLFENPPRRFKYSDNRVWHENSAPGQPRHFRVLKHKRRDVPSITPIPQFRFEGYTLTKGQAWHAALDRASVRPNQRRALAEVFAAENGSTEFTTNEVAGVTRDRLAAIGPSVGISADTPLGDLSLDHLVVLYVGFIDDALVAVGARPH